MEYLSVILRQTAVCGIVMSLGFILSKTGVMDENARESLAKLLSKFFLPAMMISTISGTAGRDELLANLPVAGVCVIILGICVASGIVTGKLFGLKDAKKNLHTAMMFCDNAGFFGMPLAAAVFAGAPVGILTVSIYLVADLTLVWTYGYYLMSGGRQGSGVSLKRLVSPVTVALAAGIACVLLRVPTDNVLFDTLDGVGSCAKYLAMLYIGSRFIGLRVGSVLKNAPLYAIAGVKLLFIPLAAFFITCAVPLFNRTQAFAVALMAGTPVMLSIAPVVRECGGDDGYALEGSLVTNALCIFTLPLVFWILSRLG